jgi:cytoplasmic iron level regulating protein YaaA (DUF328/UPF0246 family)
VLIERARQLAPSEIGSLMKISDKLAGLNAARYAQWQPDFTLDSARQAMLAFKGDVYTGLAVESFSEDDLAHSQQHLRILSGLYGVLRPLDLMMPYRLEMGIRLDNPRGRDLYAFWGDIITDKLNQALAEQGDEVLINLASEEYFKSVRPAGLKGWVVTPVFKDGKNGQYKIISFYAKKARGMMARWILQERLTRVEQLAEFSSEGYYFVPQESTADSLIFKREEKN